MTSWDWDDEQASEGMGHYADANTVYNDASIIQQAYDYVNFSEVAPTPDHCWPLHEDSGSTAADVAGGVSLNINGPALGGTGPLGMTAFDFDGVDDRLGSNSAFAYDAQSIGVTALVYPRSTTGTQTIIRHWNTNGNNHILRTENGQITFYVNGSSAGTESIQGSTTLTTDTWHLVGGSYDDTNSTIKVLLDDSEDNSSSLSIDRTDPTIDARIGANFNNNELWDGRMADVRTWGGTGLSLSQFQTLYDVINTPGDWLGTTKTGDW